MNVDNPVLATLAAVIVGCMLLFGVGLLFVRAENIERRVLVASITLVTSGIAAVILWNYVSGSGRGTGTPVACMALSIMGFAAARILDAVLGPRVDTALEPDPATLGADLAD